MRGELRIGENSGGRWKGKYACFLVLFQLSRRFLGDIVMSKLMSSIAFSGVTVEYGLAATSR